MDNATLLLSKEQLNVLDELFNIWDKELNEMSDVSELYDTLDNQIEELD